MVAPRFYASLGEQVVQPNTGVIRWAIFGVGQVKCDHGHGMQRGIGQLKFTIDLASHRQGYRSRGSGRRGSLLEVLLWVARVWG